MKPSVAAILSLCLMGMSAVGIAMPKADDMGKVKREQQAVQRKAGNGGET